MGCTITRIVYWASVFGCGLSIENGLGLIPVGIVVIFSSIGFTTVMDILKEETGETQ